MDIDKEWSYKQFIQRENSFSHAPYGDEFDFYESVKQGDVIKITEFAKSRPLSEKQGLGKLSENPKRNIMYHFVITVAMIARYCIEGGMEHEIAYSLSDFYIQKADICSDAEEILDIYSVMILDYTKRMKLLRKEKVCSKPIAKCLDYIYENLHTALTLDILAEYAGLSCNYLSRLFKKEIGTSLGEYIRIRKIETAENMLKYSEYSISEIAAILAFPSQSHFTEVFRKHTGHTPKRYRDEFFRSVSMHEK